MPRLITEGEYRRVQAQIASLGELPYLTGFANTPQTTEQYYHIVPDPSDPVRVVVFRAVVAAFWAASLGAVGARRDGGRGRAVLLTTPDLLLILVAVHSLYVGTALMEGVYERYIMPTWPLLVAGPSFALVLLTRTRRAG